MNIKPIKNLKDYKMTLKRIEILFDSKPNTPRGDELDILTTLVEVYEQKNFNIFPPEPIEAIKFKMDQLGLKQSDIADSVGGKNRVSEILNGKRDQSYFKDSINSRYNRYGEKFIRTFSLYNEAAEYP